MSINNDHETHGRSRKKSTSDKQAAANKRNAQRSTGPRTAGGKARSSANSVKHGVYARRCDAIEAGPYSEDLEEIKSYVDALIGALAPRDALEAGVADDIASVYLRERRLAAWVSGQLEESAAAEELERAEGQDRAIEFAHEAVSDWYRARSAGKASDVERDDLEGDDPEYPWEVMAVYLRSPLPKAVWVKNLWTKEREPQTPSEWERAFRAIVRHHFPGADDLRVWLVERRDKNWDEASRRTSLARRRVANSSIQILERATRLGSELTREKSKLLALYDLYRSRELNTQ